MPKSVVIAGSAEGQSASNNAFRRLVGNVEAIFLNNETWASTAFRVDGVLSQLGWSAAGGSGTFIDRINGADGALAAANSGAAGWYEDPDHAEAIAAGDTVAWRASASGMLYAIRGVFEADSDLVAVLGCGSGQAPNLATANATRYIGLYGSTVINTSEAPTQVKAGPAGTHAFLQVSIGSNKRSGSSTTFRLRKNGSNGNGVVVVPASGSGIFTDTTNTDSVSAGDLITVSMATGSGKQQIYVNSVSTHFTNAADGRFDIWTSLRVQKTGTTAHYYLLGSENPVTDQYNSIETQKLMRLGFAAKATRIAVYVSAIGASPKTYTLRVNGSDTGLTVTVDAVGWWEAVGDVNVGPDDDINVACASGSGNITVEAIGITVAERLLSVSPPVRVSGTYRATTWSPRVGGTYRSMVGIWAKVSGTYRPLA